MNVLRSGYGTSTSSNVHRPAIDFLGKWDILHRISFGRRTMKINSKNLALSVCLLSAVLVGCKKDNNGTDMGNPETPSQNAAGSQSPSQNPRATGPVGTNPTNQPNQALPAVLAQDPTLKISQSNTGERIIQSAPVVAPPAYYSPSHQDVQSALADILVFTVSQMKESPERNQYYQQQANVLQTLKVGQCTQAQIGQPVACNISISGKNLQIKLLLTNTGWAVVK